MAGTINRLNRQNRHLPRPDSQGPADATPVRGYDSIGRKGGSAKSMPQWNGMRSLSPDSPTSLESVKDMASVPSINPSHTQVPVIPVALAVFRRLVPDCDVYINLESKHGLTLLRRKGQPVDLEDLDRLSARGISHVFVAAEDQESYRRELAPVVVRDTTKRPEDRYNLLREISRALFEAAYHSDDVGQVVDFVAELAPELTTVLTDNDLVLTDLFALMNHDDCTYSHCVNVATYTMLLAKYLGIDEHRQLCEIATGGLLHDLGKRYIELGVLNKPGQLDGCERRTMSDHPRLGFQDLLPRGDLTWGQLMMVYQHHERCDGAGYPVGIPREEIHAFARMTTVADVFHALTSVRPYKTPMSADTACAYLADHMGTLFDADMAKCWIAKMNLTASD